MKYEIYKNLSKEEKKLVRENYRKTKKGDYILKKINKLLVYSIIYLVLGIILSILLVLKQINWYFIFMDIVLYICFIVFIIGYYNLKMQQYCKYIFICKKLEDMKKEEASKRKKKAKVINVD